MEIEIKNVSYSERFSEETNAFHADIYINGEKAMYVVNTGQGGPTDYHAYEGKKHLLQELEQHSKTLPIVKSKYSDFNYKQTVETIIDDLFENWLKERDNKKLMKKTETGILYKAADGNHYTYSWKIGGKQAKIADMIRIEKGRQLIQEKVTELLSQGSVILNKNL